MSLIVNAAENLRRSNRRILVVGPRGTGKTTFSVSASKFAGDTLTGEPRQCEDVLVIQGDNEGVMGAMDAGLEPGMVLDTTDVKDWVAYQQRLVGGLRELQSPLTDGTIRVVIIDLSWPAKLIERHVDIKSIADWKLVAAEGAALFRALAGLKGVTVIGNAQVKASAMIGEDKNQLAVDASNAKAIGGERSTFTVDLPKGVGAMWLDNCSFMFAREAKRTRDKSGNPTREYRTLTQSTQKFEAKSRACSKLAATLPGERTLYSILKEVYGENI